MSEETPLQTVERLALLSRLSIPAEKKEVLAAEFSSVLAYIAQLDELTLDASKTPELQPLHNIFRADENATPEGTNIDAIVSAFPARSGNSLSVKKIISHD